MAQELSTIQAPFDKQLDPPDTGLWGWCETHGLRFTPPQTCMMCRLQAEAFLEDAPLETMEEIALRDTYAQLKEAKALAWRLWQESGSDPARELHRSNFFRYCQRLRECDAAIQDLRKEG